MGYTASFLYRKLFYPPGIPVISTINSPILHNGLKISYISQAAPIWGIITININQKTAPVYYYKRKFFPIFELIIPKIKIIWWNISDIYVRYPYCNKIYYYGFQAFRYNTKQYRIFYCGNPSYNFQFPFANNGNKSWYEIDKKKIIFVTVGKNPENYFLVPKTF